MTDDIVTRVQAALNRPAEHHHDEDTDDRFIADMTTLVPELLAEIQRTRAGDGLGALRAAIANLTDTQVRGIIEAFVGGLIHGMINDVAERADQIVAGVVDNICDQITTHTPEDETEPALPEPPEPERFVAEWTPPWGPDKSPSTHGGYASCRAQDAHRRVCEICGREGTRRYVQTATGWRCAPSATKCPGNRPNVDQQPARPSAAEVEQIADDIARNVTTAQCTDCPRTWTLTGRVLDNAIDIHETNTGHIVTITEPQENP